MDLFVCKLSVNVTDFGIEQEISAGDAKITNGYNLNNGYIMSTSYKGAGIEASARPGLGTAAVVLVAVAAPEVIAAGAAAATEAAPLLIPVLAPVYNHYIK